MVNEIFTELVTIIDMEKVSSTEFVQWINSEMDNRGWSLRFTAKMGGISHSALSLVISGGQVSYETCVALAKAFNMPKEVVFVKAGLLESPVIDPELDELAHLFQQLPPEKRKDFIAMARALLPKKE